MKYYSGKLALTQYAFEEDNSCGMGAEATQYLNEREKYVRDTENSKFGNAEVVNTIIVPTGEFTPCASHARAYCDMLVEHKFEELEDLYLIAINDYSVLSRIFLLCRTHDVFEDEAVVKFLNKEFDSYFRGYLVRYGEDKALSYLVED